MKIWVENFINARSFKPVEKTIAIRVFDPGAVKSPKDKDGDWRNGPAAPFPRDLYEAVWEYTFDDVMYDGYSDEERRQLMADPKHHPFTANMADDLARRVAKMNSKVKALLIHCHAGVSRSVALAHAIDEMFELNASWAGGAARFKNRSDHYVGNEFVYRVMCEAIERIL